MSVGVRVPGGGAGKGQSLIPVAAPPPMLSPSSSPGGGDNHLKAMPTAVENAADDARLGNPLERAQRMSTSWFGLIAELEGVLVDDTLDLHQRAWLDVAAELGLPAPLGQQLRRIKGVRDELVSRCAARASAPTRALGVSAAPLPVFGPRLPSFSRTTATHNPNPPNQQINRSSSKSSTGRATPRPRATCARARQPSTTPC